MSLTNDLRALREESQQTMPTEVLAILDRATNDLEASGLADRALGMDDTAPDFELPNAAGKRIALSSLLERGPVVLSFFRGGWCPYCNLELRALAQSQPELERLGATLVGISPETPERTAATRDAKELTFEVLSDQGNEAARRFGLVFTLPEPVQQFYRQAGLDLPAANGDNSWELPVPATYVIDRVGTIAYAFVDVDYTHRADPVDILTALKAAQAVADH